MSDQIIVYPFDEEHEYFKFDESKIMDDKDKFFLVLDECNKNTYIREALVDMAEKEMVIVTHGKNRITDFTTTKAQIKDNKVVFAYLANKYGFCFTTADELAEEMND